MYRCVINIYDQRPASGLCHVSQLQRAGSPVRPAVCRSGRTKIFDCFPPVATPWSMKRMRSVQVKAVTYVTAWGSSATWGSSHRQRDGDRASRITTHVSTLRLPKWTLHEADLYNWMWILPRELAVHVPVLGLCCTNCRPWGEIWIWEAGRHVEFL
jgi:hypothetical protein